MMDKDKKISLLIIDDSRLSRAALSARILSRLPNWDINQAANADQALAMAEAKNYNLITVDINMPGMNGLDLCPLLKERTPAAKLVFITANVQDATRNRIKAMGSSLITKPIKPETVDRLIEIMDS